VYLLSLGISYYENYYDGARAGKLFVRVMHNLARTIGKRHLSNAMIRSVSNVLSWKKKESPKSIDKKLQNEASEADTINSEIQDESPVPGGDTSHAEEIPKLVEKSSSWFGSKSQSPEKVAGKKTWFSLNNESNKESKSAHLVADKTIFEGFIMKKADDSKTRVSNPWKKRYLCLYSDSLCYAESKENAKDAKKLKGQVVLSASLLCVKGLEPECIDILDGHTSDQFTSGAANMKRGTLVLRLKALSIKDAELWMTHISQAIQAKADILRKSSEENKVEEAFQSTLHETSGDMSFAEEKSHFLRADLETLRHKLLV